MKYFKNAKGKYISIDFIDEAEVNRFIKKYGKIDSDTKVSIKGKPFNSQEIFTETEKEIKPIKIEIKNVSKNMDDFETEYIAFIEKLKKGM